MPERTAPRAIDAYLAPRGLAISCVTREILRLRGSYRTSPGGIDVFLGSGEPVRLRGPERIHLRVRMLVRVEQEEPRRGLWDAQLTAYDYRLSDQDDREILAYHEHPDGGSHVRTPHLHLGVAAGIGHAGLQAAHLPTGRVALADVLRLAVESFGVEPIRRDWERVLGAAMSAPA